MQDRKHIVPLLKISPVNGDSVSPSISSHAPCRHPIHSKLFIHFLCSQTQKPITKVDPHVCCMFIWDTVTGRPMTVQHDVYMSVSTSKADRNGDTGEGKHSMHKLALKKALMYASILALNVEWKCNIAGLYFS